MKTLQILVLSSTLPELPTGAASHLGFELKVSSLVSFTHAHDHHSPPELLAPDQRGYGKRIGGYGARSALQWGGRREGPHDRHGASSQDSHRVA